MKSVTKYERYLIAESCKTALLLTNLINEQYLAKIRFNLFGRIDMILN